MRQSAIQENRRSVPTSSPDKVAQDILRCVLKRRREIVSTLGGKVFAFGGYHFPRLSDRILEMVVPVPKDGNHS